MADVDDDVMVLIGAIAQAYRDRDLPALMAYFTHEVEPTAYGTGADEKRLGRDALAEQFQRDWAQSDESAFTPGWATVHAHGDTAWAMVDVVLAFRTGDVAVEMPGRSTVVAVREDGEWRAAHWHLSVPALQDAGESFPD